MKLSLPSRMLPVLVLLFAGEVYGVDCMEPVDAVGHDAARRWAHCEAINSGEEVEKRYQALMKRVSEKPVSGDPEYDQSLTEMLQESQEAWLVFRESRCELDTHLTVYPSGSRLYGQVYNQCIFTMNKARLKYLDNLLKEVEVQAMIFQSMINRQVKLQ